MRPADTCPAKGEAPARPGRKNENPPTGHRIATGPAAGAGKAAGAEGDYTVAGRGTALESIIEKWGKKDLAKTTPKKGENKKTRGQSLISKFSLKIAEFFAVFFQNFANLAKFC